MFCRKEETFLKQGERYQEFMELLVTEDTASGGLCDKECKPKACFYSFIEPGLTRLQNK